MSLCRCPNQVSRHFLVSSDQGTGSQSSYRRALVICLFLTICRRKPRRKVSIFLMSVLFRAHSSALYKKIGFTNALTVQHCDLCGRLGLFFLRLFQLDFAIALSTKSAYFYLSLVILIAFSTVWPIYLKSLFMVFSQWVRCPPRVLVSCFMAIS